MNVLVAGELNPDLILRGCPIFPEPGKEVRVNELELTLGSSSAICAVGLAKLGNAVSFAALAGADSHGDYCVDFLRDSGIDVSRVIRRPDLKTGITVAITSEKDRALVTYPGAIAALTAEDLSDSLFSGHDHFHVSSWFLQDGLRPGLKGRFAEARKGGLTTSLDTGYDPSETWSPDILDTLLEVDVFLPNESEILNITRSSTVEDGLKKLENGHTLVVAKLGAEGCMVRQHGQTVRSPAFAIDVVDTTGAGDSFNAGFLHFWKQGHALADCLRFASACGALSTRALGGVNAQPDSDQVYKFISEQRCEA